MRAAALCAETQLVSQISVPVLAHVTTTHVDGPTRLMRGGSLPTGCGVARVIATAR